MAESSASPPSTTAAAKGDISTTVNPIHILQQLNSGFQRSKREQIDRFLRDQDDLNKRFNHYTAGDVAAQHSSEEGTDEEDGDDDVESEFNLRLDTFRVRPLSARIGSWALDDDLPQEDVVNNNKVDNGEVDKRLSMVALSSSSEDELGDSRRVATRQGAGNNGRANRERGSKNQLQVQTRSMSNIAAPSQPDMYSKYARNRDRSNSRDRKPNTNLESVSKKKLQQTSSSQTVKKTSKPQRERSRERSMKGTVIKSNLGKSPSQQQAENIDPEEKQLVEKSQPKKLLIRRRLRPRTAMGLQQTSRGNAEGAGEEEQTVDLNQPATGPAAGEEPTETSRAPALRPMRASAPAGISRMKQKMSWETEEMRRNTYMERQTVRGNSQASNPLTTPKPSFHQRTSSRQQELLASGSTSNINVDTHKNFPFGESNLLRQSLALGQNTDSGSSKHGLGGKDSPSHRLGLNGGNGAGGNTPRLWDNAGPRHTPRANPSSGAGMMGTPRLGNHGPHSTRVLKNANVDPLLQAAGHSTPRLGPSSQVVTKDTSRAPKDFDYNNPPNSPSSAKTTKGYVGQSSSTSTMTSSRRKVGLGAPSEAGGSVRARDGQVNLIKLPQLGPGGAGIGGKKGAVGQAKEHVVLTNSSN